MLDFVSEGDILIGPTFRNRNTLNVLPLEVLLTRGSPDVENDWGKQYSF